MIQALDNETSRGCSGETYLAKLLGVEILRLNIKRKEGKDPFPQQPHLDNNHKACHFFLHRL